MNIRYASVSFFDYIGYIGELYNVSMVIDYIVAVDTGYDAWYIYREMIIE